MHEYPVKVPVGLFDEVAETREDRFWSDDRGFTYAVAWSEQHQKPMVACVDMPQGASGADIWHRSTPQPDITEN